MTNDSIQLPLFTDNEPQPKRCPQCGEVYSRTNEFWHRNKTKKDGFSDWCKSCCKTYIRQYQINNRDQVNANTRKWARENQVKVNAKKRRWRQSSPNKAKAMDKRSRESNPAKRKSIMQRWVKNNYKKVIAYNHRRRARKLANGGSFTQEELQAQFESQGRRCFHCGKFISLNNSKTCHIDHWIPISKGGLNNIDNVRLLCPSCNLSKHNKLPCEWHPKYCE